MMRRGGSAWLQMAAAATTAARRKPDKSLFDFVVRLWLARPAVPTLMPALAAPLIRPGKPGEGVSRAFRKEDRPTYPAPRGAVRLRVRQVSWLTACRPGCGAFPGPCRVAVVAADPRRLQWRVRAGFSPASLFSPSDGVDRSTERAAERPNRPATCLEGISSMEAGQVGSQRPEGDSRGGCGEPHRLLRRRRFPARLATGAAYGERRRKESSIRPAIALFNDKFATGRNLSRIRCTAPPGGTLDRTRPYPSCQSRLSSRWMLLTWSQCTGG